jgi:hypothetical protein
MNLEFTTAYELVMLNAVKHLSANRRDSSLCSE